MVCTTAVNTLIFFQIFCLFKARYLKKSVLSWEGLFGNPRVLLAVAAIAILQVLFIYVPLLQNVFGTVAIPVGDWVRLISFTFTVFVWIEIEK
jgi:magnesium-transporting ATPase (P-type)